MAQKQVRFVDFKARRSYENTHPVALHYYGRFELSDWQELYYAAMKCLYLEFPDIISGLRRTGSKRSLFLRTTTLDMKKPRLLGETLYLETDRSPTKIVYALQTVLEQIGIEDGLMRIEYERVDDPLPDALPRTTSFHREVSTKPVSEIERQGNQFPQTRSAEEVSIEPLLFVKQKGKELYFIICGRMQGPFPTERERYIGVMTCLAEAFPDCLHRGVPVYRPGVRTI